MRHLGGLQGSGVLKCGNKIFARADYDLDGFLRKPGEVVGSGDIRMDSVTLRQVFGRKDLHLLTDDGRLLRIRFSETRLPAASDAAHVDVVGDLPLASEWRH
ncbi:hypothetical protein [Stappia sp.]|jgi:hypothetical protein|uniref:hypothetical protein n=1 Tax=Stappia sp. TaxID=1870903 RepID=UPI003A99B345